MSQKMFHLSVTTNIPPVVHNGEDIRDLKLSFHKTREDGPINWHYATTSIDIPLSDSYEDVELPFYNLVGFYEAQPKVGFIKKLMNRTLISGSIMVEVGSQDQHSLERERRPKS